MDLELVSRIGMNLSAAILIVPMVAAFLRRTHHQHDIDHGKVGAPAQAFGGRYRGIIRFSLSAIASPVVLFAAIQLAITSHVWFSGLRTDAMVTNAGLAWRHRGGDFYFVEYRFTVPQHGHSYSAEARTQNRFSRGELLAVRYLANNPDRHVVDDVVVAFRWPFLMMLWGLAGLVIHRRI